VPRKSVSDFVRDALDAVISRVGVIILDSHKTSLARSRAFMDQFQINFPLLNEINKLFHFAQAVTWQSVDFFDQGLICCQRTLSDFWSVQ
jgi:hypothetical protein